MFVQIVAITAKTNALPEISLELFLHSYIIYLYEGVHHYNHLESWAISHFQSMQGKNRDIGTTSTVKNQHGVIRMADDPDEIQPEQEIRLFIDQGQFKPIIELKPIDRCEKTVTRQGKQITVDIIIPEVVDWVMKSLPVVTIVEMDEIYWYYDGQYIPNGDKFIGKILQKAFGSLTNDKDKPVLTEAKIREIIS